MSLLAPQHRRLHFEPLEDRRLLAITVDTLVDGIGVPGTSLREAIAAADPGEMINFSVVGTINLTFGDLVINKNLTISGPGATLLTITAVGSDESPGDPDGMGARVFSIDDGNTTADKTVSISGLRLTGGDVGAVDVGGGAIFTTEHLSISNSTITGNYTAGIGGAIHANTAGSVPLQLTITGSTISNNRAEFGGGGIDASGANVTVSSSTIRLNIDDNGVYGGIYAELGAFGSGNVTVTSCLVENNTGTGIYGYTSVSVIDCTVRGNTNSGVAAFLDVSVTHSVVSGNSSSSFGGGINAILNVTVIDSTINDNTAEAGGGISAGQFGGDIVISNSTISGNQAENGAGILIHDGDATVAHSTITDNPASGFGGGIFALDGTVIVDHTIVAANDAPFGPDLTGLTGSTLDVMHSLIGDGANTGLAEAPVGSPDAHGNLVGGIDFGPMDPLLGSLANNGGPTRTHALLPGSPAINSGRSGAVPGMDGVPLNDQRRSLFSRVSGGRIDIGAVETQLSQLLGDYNGDGKVSAADFTVWRDNLGDSVTPYDGADGDGDGTVEDPDDFLVWRQNYGNSESEGSGTGASAEDKETGRQVEDSPGRGEGEIADLGWRISDSGNDEFRITNVELGTRANATAAKTSVESLLMAWRNGSTIAGPKSDSCSVILSDGDPLEEWTDVEWASLDLAFAAID